MRAANSARVTAAASISTSPPHHLVDEPREPIEAECHRDRIDTETAGVAIEGQGVVVEDEDVVWDVCVNIFERYNGEYTEEMKPFVEFMAKNRAAIRLDVDRVRSWDHRKLGLPAMDLGGSTAEFLE